MPDYIYTKPDGTQSGKPIPAGLSYGEKWELWEEINSNSVILEKQVKLSGNLDKYIEITFILGLICLFVLINLKKSKLKS